MKKTVLLLIITMTCIVNGCAQKENFDLLSFTPLTGWEKTSNASGKGFTQVEQRKKTWCTIFLYKSVPGSNDIDIDFQKEWEELTVRNNTITAGPVKEQVVVSDGWQIMAGGGKGKFNKEEMIILHTVASGYGVRMSVIAKTNHVDYLPKIESFISSIELKKPEASVNNSAIKITDSSDDIPSLNKFIWKRYQNRKHASGMGDNDGRSTNTYIFNNDGTYSFGNVTFQYHTPKYYVVDEKGTYTLAGNKLTLRLVKSTWRTHKTSQSDPVLQSGKNELKTVQFLVDYITIYDRQRMVLTPVDGKENKRDGNFNYTANNVLQKAYLYDAEEKPSAIEVSKQDVTSGTIIKKSGLKEIWMSVNQVAKTTYNYVTNRYDYYYDFKPAYYVVYANGDCLNDLPVLGPANPSKDAKWGKFSLGASTGKFVDADGREYELEKTASNELKIKERIEKYYRCVPVNGLTLNGWYSVNARTPKSDVLPGGKLHRAMANLFYFDKNGGFDDPGLFVKDKQNPNKDVNAMPGKGAYAINDYSITLQYTDGRKKILSFTGFNGENPFTKNDIVYISSFPLYKVED